MADPYSLTYYSEEVEAGLPNVKDLLDRRLENQAFYDLDADRYMPQREGETTFDYINREKRTSGITRECISLLTEHLYSPCPSRRYDDEGAEEFLEQVWNDNHFDSMMHEVDKLATLNDVVAIQIDAGEGDFSNRPITLRLWGGEEFWAWTDPQDATKVVALVTIDKYDQRTTYRLWNDKEVRVYRTKSVKGGTAGGRVAELVRGESANHEYGMIPFAFVHYEFPHRRFNTPGLGSFLAKAERSINDDLARICEAKHKYLAPIPIASGVSSIWQPIIEPGRWLRLPGGGIEVGPSGGFERAPDPKLEYLQADIDFDGAWNDLIRYLNQVLESCRVPLAAVRMEQDASRSGIAILAEQIPLLNRARSRRRPFQVFESRIAKAILTCAGNHYGVPSLVQGAEKGRLTLGWSEPSIPFPSIDRNEVDKGDLELGVKSRLQIIQERYGCDRDRALELLRQIAEDRAEEEKLAPELSITYGSVPETNRLLREEEREIGDNGKAQ